jgi:hypothetical protein
VEVFCALVGTQKPSTLSNERAAGAKKRVTEDLDEALSLRYPIRLTHPKADTIVKKQ